MKTLMDQPAPVKIGLGLTSPLWLTFGAAAGMGAFYWWWSRWADFVPGKVIASPTPVEPEIAEAAPVETVIEAEAPVAEAPAPTPIQVESAAVEPAPAPPEAEAPPEMKPKPTLPKMSAPKVVTEPKPVEPLAVAKRSRGRPRKDATSAS